MLIVLSCTLDVLLSCWYFPVVPHVDGVFNVSVASLHLELLCTLHGSFAQECQANFPMNWSPMSRNEQGRFISGLRSVAIPKQRIWVPSKPWKHASLLSSGSTLFMNGKVSVPNMSEWKNRLGRQVTLAISCIQLLEWRRGSTLVSAEKCEAADFNGRCNHHGEQSASILS